MALALLPATFSALLACNFVVYLRQTLLLLQHRLHLGHRRRRNTLNCRRLCGLMIRMTEQIRDRIVIGFSRYLAVPSDSNSISPSLPTLFDSLLSLDREPPPNIMPPLKRPLFKRQFH